MKFNYLLIILLTILSIISVGNLFQSGYPLTHDGDVHLLRMTNFYQSIKEGNIIPRWAANVNYGYGQPVFEFFYPLPYYIVTIIHFYGISFANGLKLILILSMIFSAYTMYLWLYDLFGDTSAFVGSVLYLFAPFRFVDTYVRGDVGESLAYVFIPLVLWCVTKIEKKPTFLWSILGGLFFAFLILSHNVVSLMALPYIIFYGFVCFFQHNKRKLFSGYLFWMICIGFLLSAFFWMPGLFESKYTLRDIVTKGLYMNRFVDLRSLLYGKWQYGGAGTDQFTVQIGVLQWLSILLTFVSLLYGMKRKSKNVFLILGTLIYVLLGIFFMLPLSQFIWSKIILLQNFQFPWRFLTVTTFGSAILAAYLVQFLPKKYTFLGLTIFLLLVIILNKDYLHAKQFLQRRDTYFLGIQRAPADTGESSPIWTIRFMEHGYTKPLQVISGNAIIYNTKRSSTEHQYKVTVKEKTRFLENTLYFPGWEILANGYQVPLQFQDEQYRGLMTFYLGPGTYSLDTKFIDTKFRRLADAITGITGIIIFSISLGMIIKYLRKKTV